MFNLVNIIRQGGQIVLECHTQASSIPFARLCKYVFQMANYYCISLFLKKSITFLFVIAFLFVSSIVNKF